MTAIWGYCVFWPKRVVYDRWQGRKSRAAGSNTDMQIAFSWLLYSLRYLSSGLQHACLFTARKQLITSTKGERKERRCFRWFHSVACKLRPLKWPASAVKLVHKCAVFHHTKADTTEEHRCLLIFSFQCSDESDPNYQSKKRFFTLPRWKHAGSEVKMTSWGHFNNPRCCNLSF